MPDDLNLPVKGWRGREEFLEAHPELQTLVPSMNALEWTLRTHRASFSPYLRRHGRKLLIHDFAAQVLPKIVLKPVD